MIKSRPFHLDNGHVGARGIIIDLSEIHRAEQETRATRLYLQYVVDLLPAILVGINNTGVVTLWNNHVAKLTDLSAEEALGQELTQVLPGLLVEANKIVETIASQQTFEEHRVERNLTGENRFWNILVYPLSSLDSTNAILFIEDVTEQIHMEKVMIQTEKMLSIGGLAAGMAHEINNPLAAIMQNAQLLIRRLQPDIPENLAAAKECGFSMEQLDNYLETRQISGMLNAIQQGSHRASDIVRDMLTFSRSEETEKQPVDLNEQLDLALTFASNDHEHYDFTQIQIEKDYGVLPSIPCSQTQIQQVLLNIIKNGAQAMASQEEVNLSPKILIRTRQYEDHVRIEIEDNGPGMDKETLKRIFEPFFTTKPVGEGTGLGLSVSYFIITENCGGEMNVKSALGQGTTFIIRLHVERREK